MTLSVLQAAYVHLPFCKRKCFYCDFPVVATGSRLEAREVQDSIQVRPCLSPKACHKRLSSWNLPAHLVWCPAGICRHTAPRDPRNGLLQRAAPADAVLRRRDALAHTPQAAGPDLARARQALRHRSRWEVWIGCAAVSSAHWVLPPSATLLARLRLAVHVHHAQRLVHALVQ